MKQDINTECVAFRTHGGSFFHKVKLPEQGILTSRYFSLFLVEPLLLLVISRWISFVLIGSRYFSLLLIVSRCFSLILHNALISFNFYRKSALTFCKNRF